MAKNADSETLRLMDGPAKSLRKVVQRISCLSKGVYANGLCVSRFPSEKIFLFSGKFKMGIEPHRQILQGHMT